MASPRLEMEFLTMQEKEAILAKMKYGPNDWTSKLNELIYI